MASQELESLVDEQAPAVDLATDAAEESVGIEPEDSDTTELDDGGAIIRLQDEKERKGAVEFYANLAEDMDEGELNELGTRLLDLYDQDLEDRKPRDEQQSAALRQTGFTGSAAGSVDFDGSSAATYPLVAEVAIDFSARAIKELWPAGGPAKAEIIGEPTDKKEQKANRKAAFLNWQLRKQMPNTRGEIEKILTQVPMGGVQYSKLRWDQSKKRPVHDIIWVDELVLPASATSFYGSPRKAHRQSVDRYEYDYRVRTGVYRDVENIISPSAPDTTKSENTNDKIEGRSPNVENIDGVRQIIEFEVQWTLKDDKRKIDDHEDTDKGPAPYLISVDYDSRQVLSIYRNWDVNDEHEESLVHIVEWPFIPWRGAMAIGVPQVLGGLAIATTGALRALLDSALINNFPGTLRLKGGPVGGQSVNVAGEQSNEIEGSALVDDIRKIAMPIPLNPTSNVLMELLQFLVQAGKDVVKTTLDEANDNTNVPVGTIMARIEQQMVVFSAIHARLHDAMGKFLMVLHRLDGTYLEDDEIREACGEQMAWKADFDAPDDVTPVSDPEVFSELQRVEQINTLVSRATAAPDLYNRRKVEEQLLKTLKIPNAKQYLNPAPEPKAMNAINENVAASLGKPVVAFPDQDHLAHIQVHMNFLNDPFLGQNPIIAQQAISGLLQNVKEHILFWYANDAAARAKAAYEEHSEDSFEQLMAIKDSSVKSALDALFAAVSNDVHSDTDKFLSGLMPIIQKCQQQLQQSMPPRPIDPSVVAQQKVQSDDKNNQAKLQAQIQKDAQDVQLKKGDQALNQQQLAQDAASQQAETEAKLKVAQDANQTKVATTDMSDKSKETISQNDNDTALQITGAKLAEAAAHPDQHAGHGVSNVINGEGVGKSPPKG